MLRSSGLRFACSLGLLIGCAGASAAFAATGNDEVQLGQPHEAVMAKLGPPVEETAPKLCPTRLVALFRKPQAILKLVFDEKGKLAAVSFVALQQAAGKAPDLHWPGLAYRVMEPAPYGRNQELTPWFFNQSAKELTYFELLGSKPSSAGDTQYLGSASISDSSAFATGAEFPLSEAEVMTQDDVHGEPIDSSPLFQSFRAWRNRTQPNAFMRVAAEGNAADPYCAGFILGYISFVDAVRP
ncbi:hypothetical protein [Rhodoferax sp.]|uniref:hypothetical protein n=1 Tax=Rhodoferax sp. TaxID=50421 RepID=UPI00374DE611